MNFEIDVSGSDIFSRDYTILVTERDNKRIMLGHKFTDRNHKIIKSKHGQGLYRYPNSRKGKSDLKIRLYCVAIYYIFKELKARHRLRKASLDICRDFSGNEATIKVQLEHFLGKKLGLDVEMGFMKLPPSSIAHKYAFLIRHDIL